MVTSYSWAAIVQNLRIYKSLFERDLIVARKDFFSDVINLVTWPTSLTITFGYVLPAVGQDAYYGAFLLIGALATTYFYLAVGFGSALVNDFETLRYIEYQMVLPLSSYRFLFWQRVLMFALHSTILSIPLLPVGKLLLGSVLDLQYFAPFKFMAIMLLSGIFFGFFALWLASWVPDNRAFSSVWRRIYTPMQLTGCYWFSFATAYKVFGLYALIGLLNPLTLMTEGIRAAVLGQTKYLSYWGCFIGLLMYVFLFASYSFYKLKKRLDLL